MLLIRLFRLLLWIVWLIKVLATTKEWIISVNAAWWNFLLFLLIPSYDSLFNCVLIVIQVYIAFTPFVFFKLPWLWFWSSKHCRCTGWRITIDFLLNFWFKFNSICIDFLSMRTACTDTLAVTSFQWRWVFYIVNSLLVRLYCIWHFIWIESCWIFQSVQVKCLNHDHGLPPCLFFLELLSPCLGGGHRWGLASRWGWNGFSCFFLSSDLALTSVLLGMVDWQIVLGAGIFVTHQSFPEGVSQMLTFHWNSHVLQKKLPSYLLGD